MAGCRSVIDVSCQSWSLVVVGWLVGWSVVIHHLSSVVRCGGRQSSSVVVGWWLVVAVIISRHWSVMGCGSVISHQLSVVVFGRGQ